MLWLWVGFFVLVILLLALDLGVLNRKTHVIGMREAIGWTLFWIALALAFNVAIYFIYEAHWFGAGTDLVDPADGREAALEFFTGYLVEKSLSIDNIFVIAMIFGYFRVPPEFQHRVLFWGILGALIFRGIFIAIGVWLVEQFDWVFYVFGAFLIFAAAKMLFHKDEEADPESSWVLRVARRFLPISGAYDGHRFTTRVNGRFYFTPLMLVLVVIEATDVVFAVDSIPAIFGITTDPFLVLTSNVFAILGLRSLYFVLAGMMDKFKYLSIALALILVFVGLKMIAHGWIKLDNLVSLAIIVGILAVGITLSVLKSRKDGGPPAPPGAEQL